MLYMILFVHCEIERDRTSRHRISSRIDKSRQSILYFLTSLLVSGASRNANRRVIERHGNFAEWENRSSNM